jgi:hypothetical protein
VVGTVNGCAVRCAFFGRLEGFLAERGERVVEARPVAWLTSIGVSYGGAR